MVPRLLRLHPSTYQRLTRLSKEADRDGAYRVAKRLRAVVMNSDGHTSGELAEILQAPRSKVSEWLQRYQTDGIDGLLEGVRSGRPAELTEKQQQQLGDILDSGPVAYGLDSGIWTSPMIAWVIEEEFGVQYHPGHVRKLPAGSSCDGRAQEREDPRRHRTLAHTVRLSSGHGLQCHHLSRLPGATGAAIPPPRRDSDSGQRLLPQGRRGLGLVQVQPALAGSAPVAALLAGIESYRTAVAAHPQERHA